MRYKLFGSRLRQLRHERELGIKGLAPELEVTYMHLSNIELGYKKPSAEFVKRVARFFDVDEEELTILAGMIPDDISEILSRYPKEAPKYLRSKFKEEKGSE